MSQGFQIEGKIHLINDIQTFDSGFTKREFVVETIDGQYPQMIKFECLKERTSLTDGLNPGDQVTVHFDIRGNEYNGRFYVNLNAWRIDRPDGGQTQPLSQTQSQPQSQQSEPNTSAEPYPTEAPPGFEDNQEDIPF